MSDKSNYETYVVAIRYLDGKRTASRRPLNVPLDLATGHLDLLSHLQIREAVTDLRVELERREAEASK